MLPGAMGVPVNVSEFEPIARERLSQMAYDFYAGGAEDEITLRENREAFRRRFLRYRVLVDVSLRIVSGRQARSSRIPTAKPRRRARPRRSAR